MTRDVRDPPRRARVAHHGIRWSGRPARQHVGHPGRGAVPDRDVAVARPAPAGAAARAPRSRGRVRPRPTPARRPATASSRSNGCAPGSAAGCASIRPRRATKPHEVRQAGAGSTPSAGSRRASRTAVAPITTTDASPSLAPSDGGESAKLTAMHVLSRGPVVRAGASVCSSWCSTRRSGRSCCPRAATPIVTRAVFVGLAVVLQPARPAARAPTTGRDRVMALYAPIGLLVLPVGVDA